MATSRDIVIDELSSNSKVLKFDWTTDGSGNLASLTTNQEETAQILGWEIEMVVTDPDSPSSYELLITDSYGCNVMGGSTAGRSTGTTEQAAPLIDGTVGSDPYYAPRRVGTALTFDVTGAGNDESGVAYIYLKR